MSKNRSEKVKVSIEDYGEHRISEITLDGREHYKPNATINEYYCDLIGRIDFSKLLKQDRDLSIKSDELTKTEAEIVQRWPWEKILEHLHKARIEISVLSDLFKIVGKTDYIALENLGEDQKKPLAGRELLADARMLKQRALRQSATFVRKSIDGLRKRNLSLVTNYDEVLRIKTLWSLSRLSASNRFAGDLTFNTVGSSFSHTAKFVLQMKKDGSTQVTIPPELAKPLWFYIAVARTSKDEGNDLPRGGYKYQILSANDSVSKIGNAQHSLLCEEAFDNVIRHVRAGKYAYLLESNEIRITFDLNKVLIIGLCNKLDSGLAEERKGDSVIEELIELELQTLLHLRQFHRSRLPKISKIGTVPCKMSDAFDKQQRQSLDLLDFILKSVKYVERLNETRSALSRIKRRRLFGERLQIGEERVDRYLTIFTIYPFTSSFYHAFSRACITLHLTDSCAELYVAAAHPLIVYDLVLIENVLSGLVVDHFLDRVCKLGLTLSFNYIELLSRPVKRVTLLINRIDTITLTFTLEGVASIELRKSGGGSSRDIDITKLHGKELLDKIYNLFLILYRPSPGGCSK